MDVMFYHPMNLHYSQTSPTPAAPLPLFYHPMNLHYSQTDTLAHPARFCFTIL